MDLQYASHMAQQLVRETRGMWQRIEVAGSIRRQRPQVKDVDLVGVPVYEEAQDLFGVAVGATFPFGEWVTKFADEEAPKGIPEGLKYIVRGQPVESTRKSVRFFWQECEFDVWVATPDTFALLWLIRTGPWEQNRLLALRAQRMGMRLAFAEGIVKGQQVLCPQTEEEVLSALSLPYVYPENRDEPGWHDIIKSSKLYDEGSIWVPNGSGLEKGVGQFVQGAQERAAKREAMTPGELRARAEKAKEELFG